MSAFLCSDYHISALADYARRVGSVWHNGESIDLKDSEVVGEILFAANLKSMLARYGDKIQEKNESYEYDYVTGWELAPKPRDYPQQIENARAERHAQMEAYARD